MRHEDGIQYNVPVRASTVGMSVIDVHAHVRKLNNVMYYKILSVCGKVLCPEAEPPDTRGSR